MKKPRPRSLLLVSVVALVVGSGVLALHRREPSARARLAAPASATTVTPAPDSLARAIAARRDRRPGRASAVAASGASSTLAGSADSGAVDVPADVLRVLPTLTRLPRDWREFAPAALTVAPFPGAAVTFAVTRTKTDATRTTWVGRGNVDGATLVAVATAGSWTAVVSFPHGDDYTITVAGGHSLVLETDPDLEACGTDLTPVARPLGDLAGGSSAATSAPTAQADEPANTSDVVFFYDAATEADVQQRLNQANVATSAADQIESTIRALVQQSNEDLARSEVTNLQWNFVGVYKIPAYDNHGDKSMETDLETFSDSSTATGKFAHDQAVATGADQMVLYITGDRDFAGIAWTPGHQAVCEWNTTHMTLAHELAHNLNCNHDRQTAGARDGDGDYNYGHRWQDARHGDSGTIMSYASYRVPYYSNPDINLDGVVLGVPENQPKAANNARVLRDNAAAMAGYRAAAGAPQITRQPVNVSVKTNAALSLSVTAIGGSLKYQWYHETTAVAGATASEFSVSAATTSDAGNYHVVVSNAQGSVQSDTVAVTVTSTATGGSGGTTGGTSSGGGGGGGGAPGGYFLAALALLAALRRLTRSKAVAG